MVFKEYCSTMGIRIQDWRNMLAFTGGAKEHCVKSAAVAWSCFA